MKVIHHICTVVLFWFGSQKYPYSNTKSKELKFYSRYWREGTLFTKEEMSDFTLAKVKSWEDALQKHKQCLTYYT